MIKILNDSNIDDLVNLINNIDTVMGQDLDENIPWAGVNRRQSLIDNLVNNWLKWESKTRNSIGWFEDGKLRTVLFIDFSITIKAWTMSYLLTDYKDYKGLRSCTKVIEVAWEEAKRVGYYECYRVIESSKFEAFTRLGKTSTIEPQYIIVVDEIVPAFEKPMTTLAWDWLFEGNAKTIESAIVKAILLPEHRNTNDLL